MKILSVSKLLPVLAVLTAAQMGRAQAPAVPDAAPAAGQNAAAAGRAGAAGAANGAAGAARGGGRGGAPRIVGGVGDINKDDPAYANFDWAPKLDYVKVKTPADEQKEFILQQGYRMDPVLTDADGIKEPTNIAFDGNGRMFVMEDRGYMLTIDAQHQREPNGLISMHEDTNNDGVYDKHTVFIDKLVFPRFMLPYGPNALLVMETDADEVWKYTDTNGDGKADKKELFVTGVGQSGNVEHQQGLLMEAMDNWLYMTVKAFRLRQLPNGTVLRETTGSNGAQWGVSQDNDGKLWFQGGASGVPSYWNYPIVYGNFAPQNPLEGDFTIAWGAPVRIMDAQQGMKDVRMPDGSLTRVTGSAGSNWVRANRMPADLQGHYLYNEPVGRMIRRIQPVISEGVTTLKNYYNGNEFVKSTDPLFRPVNLATAPDGTIYVVDMYRGIIQESTWSAPVNTYLRARVDEYGLDRFHSMGRIWRLSYDQLPRDKTMPKMNNESAAQLVTHLNHPNGWWRDTAQQLLVLKQDKSVVPALKKMVTDTKGDVVPRMHALWTLEGLGSLDAALTRSMMADSNPRMRSQAIRASETLYKGGDKTFAADYAKLAKDANTDVSIQALLTMNLLKTPDTATVAKAVMDANKAKGIQLVAGQILNPAAAGGGRGGRGGPTGPTLDAAQQASVTRGQATFAELCSQCHGADATGANKPDNSGKLAPSLANNARVSGHRDWMLNVLVHGLTGPIPGSEVKDIMVPMGSNKDEWIADVASYVRINFGNTGSVVTPQNVAQIRAATPGRTTPWTFAELDARVPKATVSNLADWKVSASHNAATARNAISSFNTWTTGNTATQPAGDIWLQVELPAAINLAEVQFTSAGAAAGGGRGGAGGGRAGAAGGAAGGPAGGPVAANAGAQVLPAAAPAAAPAVQPVVAPVVSRELRVEVSTNGTAWTPVGTVKGADGSQTLALSQSTPAKFVRIVQVQGAPALTLSTLRLFELGGAR
jgi:mono/diheme cytochrome c family protein